MIRSLLKRCRNFYGIFVILTASLFFSCQIGLGETVDTQPPEISFMESDNDPVSNAVIRGAFTLRGAWKDDGKIQEVNITISSNSLGKSAKLNGTIIENESKGEGVWQALVNPKDLDLTDGTYDVSVTVKDGSGHITEITRSYIIDNTAPVLILSRPSSTQTSEDNKIESYGQYLTFEGQAADDNDVKALVINFYSKNEPETLLYSKEINNIPPTISLDVATFLDNDAYTAIYGNEKQGEKPYYCTVTAYDGARKYSLPGEESDEDDKGNAEASYILWTDWEKASSEAGVSLKVPDLYHIKSGSYFTSASRAADAEKITNMWSSLMEKTVSLSSFKLNPENSPTYSISGLSVGVETNVENDSSLTVQLAKGLDGISLEIESMKVYLLACDANANALEGAERLYPVESTYYQKGDGQFLTKIAKNKFVNAAGTSVNLVYGQTYIIGVEGKDISGNTIMPSFDGKKFIIRFKAKMIAPEVSIESPADTISYLKKGATLTIKGTASVPDGYPVLKIKCKKGAADSEVIYTHNFTDSDKVNATENLITYGFQFTVNADGSGLYSFDQNNSTQYVFDIITSLDDMSTAYTKTVLYDVEAPVVDIESMLPTASKYSDNEEIEQPTGQYLNGSVTMKVSVIDAYDTVDTEKSYWSIISSKSPEASAEKHKFTTPAKEAFVIDTKAIAGTEEITVKIYAQDRAGNATLYERKYKVDQTTDIPLIRPYTPKAVTLKYASSEQITTAIANRISKSILTTGSPLQIKIIDDDGIKSCSFKISDKDTGLNLQEPAEIDQTITGSPVEYIFSYTLPTVPGRYKCSLTVTDILNNTMPAKEFWILVTGPAPVVTISSTTPQNKIITLAPDNLTNLTENAQKQITNIVSIDSGYDSFIVKRQEQGCAEVILYGSSDENKLQAHEFTDTFTPSSSRTANKVTYTVIDENNHSGDRIFEYFVDSTAPVIDQTTISVPDNKQTESVSFRFTGTANDTSETNIGNTTSSGVLKLQYTFDESQAVASARSGDVDINHPDHIIDVANVTSLSENVYFSATEYDYAFGTGKEGEKKIFIRAIDAVGNIGSWVSKSFMYDKAKPVVTINKYKRDEVDSEDVSLPSTESKAFQSGKPFTLKGTAKDGTGLSSFEIWQNDLKLNADINSNGDWTITGLPKDANGQTSLVSGIYTYKVIATDNSAFGSGENAQSAKSTTEKVIVTVDVTRPKVKINIANEDTLETVDTNLDSTVSLDSTVYGISSLSGTAPYTFNGQAVDGETEVTDFFYAFTNTTATPSKYYSYGKPSGGNWNIPMNLGTGKNSGNEIVISDNIPTTLYEGQKYLWVYGIDEAGNESIVKRVGFMVDQAVPEISDLKVHIITATGEASELTPAEGSTIYLNKTTNATGYRLSGKVRDVNGISNVTVDGLSADLENTANDDGSYNWSWENSNDQGDYTHEIVVYDKSGRNNSAGKSNSRKVHVIFDTTDPDITNVNLDSSSVIADNSTWFKGTGDNYITGTARDTGSGLAKIEIKPDNQTNWSNVTLQDDWTYKFTIPDNLSENDDSTFHTVQIRVTDKANNETTKNYYFRYDKTLPEANLELNKNDSYVKASDFTDIMLTGYAHDGNTSGRAVGSAVIKVKKYNEVNKKYEELSDLTMNVGPNSTDAGYNGTAGEHFGEFTKSGLSSDNFTDGKYSFALEVKDKAGNSPSATSTLTQTFVVDTTKPVITSKGLVVGNAAAANSIRSNNSKATIQVTFTEANVDSVYYYVDDLSVADRVTTNTVGKITTITEAASIKDEWLSMNRKSNTGNSYTYEKSHQFNDGKGKVYIKIVDKAGNIAYDISSLSYEVDTKAPDVCTLGTVSAKNDDGSLTSLTGTKLINGTKPIVFTVTATDHNDNYDRTTENDPAKIKSVVVNVEGGVVSAAGITYSHTDAGLWTITLPANQSGQTDKIKSGAVSVRVTDTFDNYKDYTSLFTLDLDNQAPRLEKYSVTSSYDAGIVSNVQTFYMNNNTSIFKLEGIAKDDRNSENDGNGEIEKVELTLTGTVSGTTIEKTFSSTETGYTFEIKNDEVSEADNAWKKWSNWEGEVTGRITATDKAKNISETKTFKIIFDTAGPVARHLNDSEGKDIYFRIGDQNNDSITSAEDRDVGGKYKAGTYSDSNTIKIRGSFADAENGSGINYIYYKVFQIPSTLPSGITTSEAYITSIRNSFVSNYESEKTGLITPLRTPEKRRVFYTGNVLTGGTEAGTTGRYYKDIDSDYKATLSGLETGNNYILILAVDKVGNVTFEEQTFQINYDDTAPTITEINTDDFNKTYIVNAQGKDSKGEALTISGKVKDDRAGLRSFVIKVNDTVIDASNIKYDTNETSLPTGDTTEHTWTATIPAAILNAQTSAIAVYAEAVDDAGSGHSVNRKVGSVQIDNTVPSIRVTSTAGWIKNSISNASVYVNDANGLKTHSVSETNTNRGAETVEKEYVRYYVYASDDFENGVPKSTATLLVNGTVDVGNGGVAAISTIDTSNIEAFVNGKAYIIRFEAEDIVGNKSYVNTENYNVDRTGPTLDSTVSGVKDSVTDKKGTDVGADDTWYNAETLTVYGMFNDKAGFEATEIEGSGVASINYTIVRPSSTNLENITGTWLTADGSYSASLAGFKDGINILQLNAEDNLGNPSTTGRSFTVKVDTVKPVISEVHENDFKTVTLTNGSESRKFEFDVSDSGSGITTSAASVTVKAGSRTISNGTNGSSITVGEAAENGKKRVTVIIGPADLSAISGNNSVLVTVKDKANNESLSQSIGTLNVDKDKPEVEVTSHTNGETVNKTITISGKVTDPSNSAIRSVYLTAETGAITRYFAYTTSVWNANTDYSLNDIVKDNASNKYYKCKAAHTSGTTFETDKTDKWDEINSITYANGQWTASLDTRDFNNTTSAANLELSLTATDAAGNTSNNPEELTLSIDQNTDRPVISFTNLPWAAGTGAAGAVKEYNKNLKILSGIISDDDGSIQELRIAVADTCPSDFSSVSAITVNSTGAFSIDLGDDGTKKLWLYVKDKKNGEFVTGAAEGQLKQPYLLFSGNSEKKDDSTATTFKINNTSPTITASGFAYGQTENTVGSEYGEFTSTSYAGGSSESVRRYVRFKITARTSIDVPVASVKVSVGGIDNPIEFPETGKLQEGNTETWYSAPIDVTAWTHGSHTLTFTVEDASGLFAISEPKQIMIDKVGPSVSLISPRGEEVTSPVSLVGTSTDEHTVEKIGFVVADNRYYSSAGVLNANADTQIKAAAKLAADTNKRTGTESAWQFVLNGQTDADGKVNPSLPTNEGSEEGGIENVTTGISLAPVPDGYGNESDTRNLTLVLYACDELGNETWTYKNILYNPFADRPMAAVTYPLGSWVNAANVADYSVLNGSIRVTGSAQDNVSMTPNGKVFVQLDLNNDGEFDSEDLELLESLKKSSTDISPIYSVAAGNLVKGAGSIQGQTNLEALGDAEKQAAFWGIPVKGTNSWSITINSYNELKQLTSASIGTGEYKIGIRAVAMDNTGVFGTWGAKQYFKIDQNVPSIGDAEIIATDENGNVISAQVAEKYEQDMYLSGNKKLRLYISDNEGLESVNYIYASSLEGLNSSSYNGTIEKTTLDANKPSGKDEYGMYKYSVDIPLSSLTSTVNSKTVALKVTAKKKDDAAETYERYLVHFDDEAPEIKNLTLNSVEHSGSANASENKVVNSNLIFTLGGRSEDLGAGFARMSFYFIRDPRQGTTGSEKRLYDVIDASKESIPVSGLDTQVVTVGSGANARTFTIYGKEQTSITVSNNGLSLAGYDTDPHVHAGGYVLIGSKWHKIESISGTTVNLSTATNASGTTSVFFAYLQTIDNTSTERRDDNNELLITGDDGDGLCESIIKSQTKWDYDVSFDSRNIPDGPGKFVVFVYDKAGNVSAKEYAVSIQNNAPRLTKLWLATDLSGDGKFQDIASEGITELVEYNVLSKVGEQTNYKDMNTVDYRGENFIIKNKLAVIPEFTGGNGAIKMALNNNAATSTAITSYETDAAAAAAGALYISQGATAVPDIASFTLARSEDTTWAYVIDNDTLRPSSPTENRAMSFTFWDSTEETAPGVDSNWCYLRIKDLRVNVDDVTAPKVVVSPFKWDSKNNNSLYKNSSENGHIELEADLSETVFTATSGLLDRDPKVSGKITIRGTAYDDYTLSSIWVAFDEFTPATGTYTATKTLDSLTYYKLASYTNGSWVCSSPSDTATVNGTTWAFKVTNNYIRASGHKASWQLDIDTAGITGRMGLDKKVYVRAIDATGDVAGAAATVVTDHTSNLTATGTAESEDYVYSKPTYRMDIVPYITKVLDENSNTATRSRLGRYPVRMGKEIYLEGFNFGDGTLSVKRHKTVNGIASTTAETDSLTATRVTGDNNRIQITAVPNFSGFLNLTITPTVGTALTAINNSNSASAYNIQKGYDAEEEDNAGNKTYGRLTANRNGTDFWTDDIYLSVWNVAEDSLFPGSINPHSGVIKKITTQNSGSNWGGMTGNNYNAAPQPGQGWLYKQPGQNGQVDGIQGMNDSYYAAISSDDLKLYGYVSGKDYVAAAQNGSVHGDNIAFNSSETAYFAPVDEMDYTIVNGMPYYVYQDNSLGGDSGSVWGLGLSLAREGTFYSRQYFNTGAGNTIEEEKLPFIIERQGYNLASHKRNSSTGYDSVLYQFKNPRIAGWYNANDTLLYSSANGGKYVNGVDYIYVSYYDSYAKCLKYAAFRSGHRVISSQGQFATVGLGAWGKCDVSDNLDIVAEMTSSPRLRNWNNTGDVASSSNQPEQQKYNHMTDGASVVAGSDTTSNNPTSTVVAGEWSDIFVDSTGASPIPVIIYYNMTAKSLEIARGNNSFPQATSEWTKTLAIRPTGVSSDFGRYVSAAMDTAGNLHVAAQDADNSILYYLYLTKTGDTYTVSKSIAVDGSSGAGRWTDIELTNPAETSLAAIAPVISYIDTSFMGTTKGIKVAYLVGTEPDGTPIFEAMTDPARYAPNDQRTSVMADVKETKSSTTKATVGVGFNSDKLALDFLRDE